MPISAVRYYRRAAKKKNTLASANLAYMLMDAGFYDEAKATLDGAKVEKDPHPNVGNAIAALSQRDEEEDKKREEILDRALSEQRFIKDYARSRFTAAGENFTGRWKGSKGEIIELVCEGATLSATWTADKNKKEVVGSVVNRSAKITGCCLTTKCQSSPTGRAFKVLESPIQPFRLMRQPRHRYASRASLLRGDLDLWS